MPRRRRAEIIEQISRWPRAVLALTARQWGEPKKLHRAPAHETDGQRPAQAMASAGAAGLHSSVLQQQEEEERYAREKGRSVASPSHVAGAAPSAAATAREAPPSPLSVASSDAMDGCASPSAMPTLVGAMDPASPFRGAGAIFITRYSRRNSFGKSPLGPNSLGPPCGARTSIPDRVVRAPLRIQRFRRSACARC